MYIKYLGNIHNLRRYRSIHKSTNNAKGISLLKGTSHVALDFYNEDSRDYILNSIWQEIEKGSKFFDIDKATNEYYEIKKYNL